MRIEFEPYQCIGIDRRTASENAWHSTLFNGVKRNYFASVLVNKQCAPNGHAFDIVIFELRAFLEKDADVVAKGTRESNRATRVGETVESIELGYSLPLLAGFKDWY